MRASIVAACLLLAACNVCNRDPKFWVPGQIVVTFKDGVTSAQAKAAVERLGYMLSRLDYGIGVVTVPRGAECDAEDELRKEPEVASALQDFYVGIR